MKFPPIDDYMVRYFAKRTHMHIRLVRQFAECFRDKFPFGDALVKSVERHDESKFVEPEFTPYVLITWRYNELGMTNTTTRYSKEIEKALIDATIHHVRTNPHHPEYWDKDFNESKFPSQDRDGLPEQIVDATRMPPVYIGEMCCDWLAVSVERGTLASEWRKLVVNVRWKFTDSQIELIDELLDIGELFCTKFIAM